MRQAQNKSGKLALGQSGITVRIRRVHRRSNKAATRPSTKQWPPDVAAFLAWQVSEGKPLCKDKDRFLVPDVATLAKISIPKGQWIGLYSGPLSGGERVCVGTSPMSLCRRVRSMNLGWPLACVRAEKRCELPPSLNLERPSNYSRLKYCAFQAIAQARRRGDDDFLRNISNAARATGEPVGDKPTPLETRTMLDVLARLAEGKTMKEISGFGSPARSLSVRIGRFARRLRSALEARTGPCPRWPNHLVRHILKQWDGKQDVVLTPEQNKQFEQDVRAAQYALDRKMPRPKKS